MIKAKGSSESSCLTTSIKAQVESLPGMRLPELRDLWRKQFKKEIPNGLSRDLLTRTLAWAVQEAAFGGHDAKTIKLLDSYARLKRGEAPLCRRLKPGTVLVREYQGVRHTVTVTPNGLIWHDKTYCSLTQIARAITGTNWNGPRFFGLRVRNGLKK